MSRFKDLVTEFHKAAGSTYIGETPAMRDEYCRAKLILEEAMEFCVACGLDPVALAEDLNFEKGFTEKIWRSCKPSLIEAVDALGDLYYVTAGGFVAFGVNDDLVFDEVHRSNMEKFPNGKVTFNALGKVMKPKGWKPPDIEGVLNRQGNH